MDILQDIYAGAVIAAGGMAQRMQGINKQSLMIQGVPVLVRSIQRMVEVKQIRQIVVVARPELFSQLKQWKAEYSLPDFEIVAGGESRQQSVLKGIKALSDQTEYFVIHDGARPFADRELILRCLQSAVEHGAATAAVKTKDTIKRVSPEGIIEETPNREFLYLTQTPQIFKASLYHKAVEQAEKEGLDFTDDCQLIEHIGHRVWVSQGDYRNIKITTPEDIAMAQAIAQWTEQK